MSNDPTIDEVRRIRREISREVDHDLHRLKAVFEMLESQFERPPVDHGGRRVIHCNDAVNSGDLPIEDLSSPAGER